MLACIRRPTRDRSSSKKVRCGSKRRGNVSSASVPAPFEDVKNVSREREPSVNFVDETHDVAVGYDDYSYLDNTPDSDLDFRLYGSPRRRPSRVSPTRSPDDIPQHHVDADTVVSTISPNFPPGPATYSSVNASPPPLSQAADDYAVRTEENFSLVRIGEDSLYASSSIEIALPEENVLRLLPPVTPLYVEPSYVPFENRNYAVLLRHFKVAIGGPWVRIPQPGVNYL